MLPNCQVPGPEAFGAHLDQRLSQHLRPRQLLLENEQMVACAQYSPSAYQTQKQSVPKGDFGD